MTFYIEPPLGENNDYTLADTLEDNSILGPSLLWEDCGDYDKQKGVMQNLTETEQVILSFRFGLDDRETRTLDDLGKELEATRERVRQIQVRVLEKLQEWMEEEDRQLQDGMKAGPFNCMFVARSMRSFRQIIPAVNVFSTPGAALPEKRSPPPPHLPSNRG